VRIAFERESPRVMAQRAQALLLVGWLASRLAIKFNHSFFDVVSHG
jgi:hypothetical protein